MNNRIINVKGAEVTIATRHGQDYISLTDMLKAKDGDFFISDWLRNRNTVEFLGIWESVYNPDFNYGEFATIKGQAGLNSYKRRCVRWGERYTQAASRHWRAKRNREMTESTITCPNCTTAIPLAESLAATGKQFVRLLSQAGKGRSKTTNSSYSPATGKRNGELIRH